MESFSESNFCGFPGQHHLLAGRGMETVGVAVSLHQRSFPLASRGCVLLIANLC